MIIHGSTLKKFDKKFDFLIHLLNYFIFTEVIYQNYNYRIMN